MPQKRPSREVAFERYICGQCPLCGKGKGDSKGVELRPNKGDMYCHSCGRSWTRETVLQLKHELPVNGAKHPLELAATAPSVLGKTSSRSLLGRFAKTVAALVGK